MECAIKFGIKKVFEVFVTNKSNKSQRSHMKFRWRDLFVIFKISYSVVKQAYAFVMNDDFTRFYKKIVGSY